MSGKKYPGVVIYIAPLIDTPSLIVDFLACFLEEDCGVTVVKLPDSGPIPEGCIIGNFSYAAEDLFEYLTEKSPATNARILALTDRNIFVNRDGQPTLGASETGLPGCRSVSVVSLGWAAYGLENDPHKHQKFLDRIIKIAAHELGHAFGLDHCENTTCALCPGDKMPLDERFSSYCEKCQKKVDAHLELSEEYANWKNLSFGKKLKWHFRVSWLTLKKIIPRR